MKRVRDVRFWSTVAVLLAGLGAVRWWTAPAGAQPQPPPPALTPATPVDSRPLFTEYRAQCGPEVVSIECAAMRGIIRARVVDALEGLESGRDQRSLDSALAAVSLGDQEPDIKQAALRLLRLFPDDRRVTPAVGRLLEDPHPVLQQMAATFLEDGNDSTWQVVAQQWNEGRSSLPRAQYLSETRLPPDLGGAGFTPYPGATHFSPADADRAVGWRTSDPVDRVTKFYAAAAHTKALDGRGWESERQRVGAPQSQFRAALSPEQAEIQRLASEYQRTHKIALVRRMQKLALAAARNARNPQTPVAPPRVMRASEAGLYTIQTPPGDPGSNAWRTVRVVPLEVRADKSIRAAVIYREDAIGATVIQLLWDPVLFGAWDRNTGAALHAATAP